MKKVYEREIKDFYERARNAVMMKAKVADTKKFGLKGDKGSVTPDLPRGGGRGQRSTPSLQEFSANLKASESDLNEKQKFDMVRKPKPQSFQVPYPGRKRPAIHRGRVWEGSFPPPTVGRFFFLYSCMKQHFLAH